jgi:hypothetical protein
MKRHWLANQMVPLDFKGLKYISKFIFCVKEIYDNLNRSKRKTQESRVTSMKHDRSRYYKLKQVRSTYV